jgi:hypothetical protein
MRLMPLSPAIDKGTGCGSVPSTDKDGKPRRNIAAVPNATDQSGVDIGAYEYQGGASDSTVTNICPTH